MARQKEGESEVLAAIEKIQQQLGYLEKKIDTLVAASSQKSHRDNGFAKSFRTKKFFRHDNRPGKHRGSNRERTEEGQAFAAFRGGPDSKTGIKKKRPFRHKKKRF